jgi:transcriptional regulator with XRE-family HTH domain
MSPRIQRGRPRRRTFIKEWRKVRRLTQQQLADRLDMSKASFSRIEAGKQAYTQDFLEALAEELNTDPASLIMRDPTKEDALWSIWDQAKPGERRQILDIAKVLMKRAQ